ncbi:translocase of chloroplast 159, chloroplastic [Raphanus sativus]|uniref:Translocase of chloroplast 159, chloroplastic n=1 Tax=Raphanus sativus TaxID=3726 RepID=A0A6J0MF73_RAPSA|nr:translocase of chloroplast 159, chloroplastic [Raphanus sativus]
MERRERLRGISIIAAEAVNPEKSRGIAVPAVRAVVADALLLTRSLSGTFSSPGSISIRAPVTLDDEDDDDDGSVIEEHNSASYSKEIDSGTDDDDDDDDGFESVSGDADDEAELEDVIRVLGEESVGENGDGSEFSPLGRDVEEEAFSVNYSPLEEEESEVSDADEDGTKAEVVIPRASLSLDDDEVLGSSGDEEVALLRVTRGLGDEGAEVEDRILLQFGDKGMVDEPECSGSVLTDVVSTEDEAVEMKVTTDGLEDGSVDDFVVENEASVGLDGSSRKLIDEGVVDRTATKEDGGGSIHESDALMKPGDVEGVEGSAVELGERGVTVLSEGSGSVTGELVSTEEDVVQVNLSDDASVSFETAPGDCSEFVVDCEGNAVDADEGLDETFSELVEKGVGQESVSKESDNKTDDGRACEADELMIEGEESTGLGSRESEDEDTGFMIGEANVLTENACSAVGKLESPECEDEPDIGMSSESSQVTPTLDSATTRNLDVSRGVDVAVSGCDSSNQKAVQKTEKEGTQGSEDIDRKLSLPDEDRASSLASSFEMANEGVENGEQIDKQVNFQSDSVPNQISVGIEETSLLSVKDVERSMPEHSCVTENETQISRLIHNHTCMEELDEFEGTGDTKEKLTESTFQNHSEELSPDPSLQLISGRVKERIAKSKLLKDKIQRIIKGIDLCNEDSAVTEADESQQSLVGEEHHTSSQLDDPPLHDETKTKLPEQELPLGLDLSINVLVLGKTGVGKSATINSIFGETKATVGAFRVTTKSANYVVGNVGGILITILDTPGLMSSASEERYNQDVLASIKKSMRRFPVDVVLYIDRLDENPDVRLLRTITSSLGSSIWRNAIVVLTHAASDVPEDSSSYTAQRSSLMHQSIREAVPELSCVEQRKMPGIVLAENNMSGNKTSESTCQDWRLNLLILCCSVKIRCKSGSLLKENTLVEKPDAFDSSQLRSFTLFCSLWNMLLLGSNNQGHASQSLDDDDLEEKKRRLLESYPEILWDEESQESLEQQETPPVKNQGEERESVRRGRRRRSGRLGFQATKRLGIYLETSDLHTGFSMGSGGSRKVEQEEGKKMVVRMRGSLSVLGLVHVLMSVITSVYGRKDI